MTDGETGAIQHVSAPPSAPPDNDLSASATIAPSTSRTQPAEPDRARFRPITRTFGRERAAQRPVESQPFGLEPASTLAVPQPAPDVADRGSGVQTVIGQVDIEQMQSILAEHEPVALDARLKGETLWAQWRWPANLALDTVAVVWRENRYPESPTEEGVERQVIRRREYEQAGAFKAEVGPRSRLFVRVFGAMPLEPTSPGDENWLFSPGEDRSTWSKANHPCIVQCKLLKKKGTSPNWLEISTADGGPLPDLVVVRRTGSLPLKVAEGEVVSHVSANTGASKSKKVVGLDVEHWPRRTIVRVFLVNPDDSRWVSIDGVRIEVN